MVLTALSIAFIPVMFFYYRKYPLVGRAPRKNKSIVRNVDDPVAQEVEATTSRPLLGQPLGSIESNEGFTQSISTFGGGVGDSMPLRPLLSKSSRETQSDNSSKERKSVTISHDITVHHHHETSAETGGEAMSFVISPPPSENARGRRRSGSTSDKNPK